jgi:hypothetical protein
MESETGETRGQVNRADWWTVYKDRARGRQMESETGENRGQANRADWGTVCEDRARGRQMESETGKYRDRQTGLTRGQYIGRGTRGHRRMDPEKEDTVTRDRQV